MIPLRIHSSAAVVAAVGLLSLLSLGACGRRETSPERVSAPVLTARFATAERLDAERQTEVTGTVEAERSSTVSSRVMAMVTAVLVDLGDSVSAGQVLAVIDPTTAEGQVAQARGALAQAEAALTLARRNFERYEALAKSQAASELEVDVARSQFEQARGAVEQAQGAVAAASSVARESSVRAPFAGRVALRQVEVGDLAAPGRPLFSIESRTGRRLAVAVSETLAESAALAIGSSVAVTLDAAPELGVIDGRVVEISPGPDPMTHAYTLKIDLPHALPKGSATNVIPAGSAGRARLAVGRSAAVLVPREALIESGGLTLVVVRDAEGRAETRVVTVGGDLHRGGADARVEILSGLIGGESVALGLTVAPPAGARFESAQVSQAPSDSPAAEAQP
jgi:membrane fusion protein, multidrug efflux system